MNKENAFTLIELLVTLVVVSILLAVGVPGFRDLVSHNALSSQTNQLVAAMQQARSEAIRRGATVTLCPANAAQDACQATDVWEQGWLVFQDDDEDGILDPGETLIRNIPRLEHADSSNRGEGVNATRAGGSFSGNSFIQFSGSGFADRVGRGTLVVCDHRGAAQARAINLTAAGRVNTLADDDATVTDFDGNAVTCP